METVVSRFIFIFVISTFSFAVLPQKFSFTNNDLSRSGHSENSHLPSNSVVDIRQGLDNKLFFGTSGGLGYAFTEPNDIIYFGTFEDENLPVGSNPALVSNGDVIAVSGGVMKEAAGGLHPAGSGIGYSTDGGETWNYKSQPVDSIPAGGVYQTISWGGQEITQLAVTTVINNISYDLAIVGDYIYSTSWAGGLRRFKYQNLETIPECEDQNPWEIIPLPMDDQFTMDCGYIDTDSYELNPNDPINGGSHNHKGFSVYASDDTTIWVGTAAGINKGIIDPFTNCINWEHYNALTHGFSGNWVIGFAHQEFEEFTRIWAITWSTGGVETNAVSYSDDGGTTWSIAGQIEELNIKAYNIFTEGDTVYVSTENGLFITFDAEHWAKFPAIQDADGQTILSETVYSSIVTDDDALWVGTPDGIARTYDLGLNWDIYRFWELPDKDVSSECAFYAYPNPFYLNEVNQFEGDGYVRFVFNNGNSGAELDIFNFSMEKVIHLKNSISIQNDIYNNAGEFIWNGRNSYGYKVTNGVYFCKLTNRDVVHWTKVVVIN